MIRRLLPHLSELHLWTIVIVMGMVFVVAVIKRGTRYSSPRTFRIFDNAMWFLLGVASCSLTAVML